MKRKLTRCPKSKTSSGPAFQIYKKNNKLEKINDNDCQRYYLHAIVCHMMCMASEINNNAHSPRTCWCPRCLARGLCHMNMTCLPVKSTRQHVRSTHPVRQPPERRHRSPCTLQHDSQEPLESCMASGCVPS